MMTDFSDGYMGTFGVLGLLIVIGINRLCHLPSGHKVNC